MKKCPFCKNEIETSAAECPICKMVLIEKIALSETASSGTHTMPPKSSQQKTYKYTPPYKSSRPDNNFKAPKIGQGWIVSIVGSILLTIILNHRGAPNPLPAPKPNIVDTASAPETSHRRLENGTVLYASWFNFEGSGVLTISNGSGSDAVVKLITDDGQKVYSVYIRSNDSYSINKINDGVYRVLFSFGNDWDAEQKKFLVNPSAKTFDETFDYNRYQSFEITLNPVAGGDARTNPVDADEFNQY